MMNASEHDGRRRVSPEQSRRVSPRPYIIVALIFAAIGFGGYGVIRWLNAHREATEAYFRRPVLIHDKGIYPAAFSADGRRVVSGSSHGAIRLWDAASGRELKSLKIKGGISAVGLPPGGRRALAVGRDGTIITWDLETGETTRRSGVPTGIENAFSFSPDGRRLFRMDSGGNACLLDVETGEPLGSFIFGPNMNLAVFFSSQGARGLFGCGLFGGSRTTLQLLDLETGKVVHNLTGQTGFPRAAAFFPDGRRALSVDSTGEIVLWDLETGKALRKYRGNPDGTRVLAVSPDGQYFASGGKEYALRLREIESGRTVRVFAVPAHEGVIRRYSSIYQLKFAPDGRHLLVLGWWRDQRGEDHREFLLWRLPDKVGYWLLGTQEEEKSE